MSSTRDHFHLRCERAKRMSGLRPPENAQLQQQPLIFSVQVVTLLGNQVDGAKAHVVGRLAVHG